MICWYCKWGWPKQVYDIYLKGVESVGEMAMDFGPAHVVWADENFDDSSIRGCITDAQDFRGELTDDEIAVVMQSLEDLLRVPESVRCCEPENYDGEFPEKYPPPEGVEMMKPR